MYSPLSCLWVVGHAKNFFLHYSQLCCNRNHFHVPICSLYLSCFIIISSSTRNPCFFSLLHSQKPFMSSSYVRLVALPKEHWDCNISCGVIMFSCRDSIVSSIPFIIYLLAMSLYPIQQPYAFCTLQIQFLR